LGAGTSQDDLTWPEGALVRNPIRTTLAISLSLGLSLAVELAAQDVDSESILEVCSGEELRQFDFWLGDWQVTDTAGTILGMNVITRVANGCGVLEHWTSESNGNEGMSLNWYDRRTGKWTQVWVGSGLNLTLTGSFEGGRMVLAGERNTEEGIVVDRITWVPLEDGRVRQLWDISKDGGVTWETAFDGTYTRVKK